MAIYLKMGQNPLVRGIVIMVHVWFSNKNNIYIQKTSIWYANALGFYNPNTTTNDCDTRAAVATTTGFYAAEPDVTMKFE